MQNLKAISLGDSVSEENTHTHTHTHTHARTHTHTHTHFHARKHTDADLCGPMSQFFMKYSSQ